MMSNSKELVKKAIEFRNPERVPYNFDSNRTPVITEKYGDDFEWVFSTVDPDFKPKVNRPDRYENEFGIVYNRIGKSFGEAVEYPLADPNAGDAYQLPDYIKPVRFKDMERIVREKPDKYILGMFPHFLFQMMLDLYGFENLMMAFYDHREAVERMAEKMTAKSLAMLDFFAKRWDDDMIDIEDIGLQDLVI